MREGRPSGTATVLFTDLVGSTDLLSRLGEAAFDEVRRAHFAILREALARHGGEEVKTLGDGVLAVFGSASDAVAGAVAIQGAVDRQARRGPVPLSVRVGLALGDVSFEEEDVFGTPVVEAARLVATAAPGQILATAAVRWAGGSRSGASFTDRGLVELKGLPEPVPTCEVLWPRLPAAPVPLPSVLGGRGRIFVGREDELGRLRQRWKAVEAGERHVVFVGGEPGVGKTRLATELARGLHDDGAVVLAGRCDEELGVPYQPFVEALRHYLHHAAEPRLGRHGGELARLVPELVDAVPGLASPLRSDPETERYRLFDAVAAWLADTSADGPMLLVLDDLQWAAKPTLLLLRHVVRSPEPLRVLVVATYRDSDIGRRHPLAELLADVPRLEGAERLPILGLDVPAVLAFLEQAAGHVLGDEGEELARAVWRETEGNAFFVAEVIRHLTESGTLEHRDGRWVVSTPIEELGIPEGVRDVVGRRLARLSEATNRVLACASVVGVEFDPSMVQLAGGFSEDAVLTALEEAVASRLVVEVAGTAAKHRFGHALVRATLYDELSAARRVSLHRKVAEALEARHAGDLDEHLPALAFHFAHASAPAADAVKAVDYAARAGDRALSLFANDEAVGYFQQALELLETASGPPTRDGHRLDLLIALGEAQRRAGDPSHRQTLLAAADLARQRGDADALARAALANNRGFWSTTGTVDAERVAALDAALSLGDPGDSPLRARLLANLAVELHYSGMRDRRLALSDDALAMARRLGDPASLAHVILARCSAIWEPSTAVERLANTAELLSVADGLADPAVLAWAHVWRCLVATGLSDVAEADRSLDKLRDLARELGQPSLSWVAGYLTIGRLMIAGRLGEAEALAVQTRELGLGAGQPDAGLFFGTQRFYIRFEQGRLGELVERLADVLEHSDSAPRRLLLALTYCELSQDEDARRLFEPLAPQLTTFPIDAGWLELMAVSAAVCAHLRLPSVAAPLVDLLAPYAGHLVGAGTYWSRSVSYHLGLLAATLGRFDDAEERFAAAAATEERIGAPAWLARTRLEWARMLLARRASGDAERARGLLGQALATARELGLAGIEQRAVPLLEQTG
jgi:class 3 adenylate cyclase/tetratricopeptide (TPR) repeat protein